MVPNRQPKTPPFSRARFARLYHIHNMLCSKCYPNVPILAEQLEVSMRTIERDIEYLRDRLGAPILYCHRKRGYYYENNDFQLLPINLTEGELIALFLGQNLLAQCIGTPIEGHIRSAFEKILVMMQKSVLVDWQTIEKTVSFDVNPLRGDEKRVAEMYGCLATAIGEKNTIWIRYYGAVRDQINERYVDPYHLRYYQGAWYLIGYCHLRKAIRIFALDRMLNIKRTEKNFVVDPEFSLEEFLKSSLGIEFGEELNDVTILFDCHQARWIRERRWHPSQRLEFQEDGSLILKMKISSLDEVKRWVLGFGCHAEVLEPEELRQSVAEEIKAMECMYN